MHTQGNERYYESQKIYGGRENLAGSKQIRFTEGLKAVVQGRINTNPTREQTGNENFDNIQDIKSGNSPRSQTTVNTKNQKKEKYLKRHMESNSIDEEEFNDYMTNPIQRREFDNHRKRQQMQEMQNFTGFTLGQYGIKSAKALKDALPPDPYENAHDEESQEKKNYATVALCCLSVSNPFRNKVIQIVAINPWFDRIVLLIILVNCMFLALDKEVDIVTKNIEYIDMIFLVLYTIEMLMKVIAMGFVTRPYSYLRDSWNILDFTVVCIGWISLLLGPPDAIQEQAQVENVDDGNKDDKEMHGEGFSAIRVVRLLRPLRTINSIPNMSSLVSTILNSLPIMFDVMVLFIFILIIFGTVATQLLGGHLIKRCTRHLDNGEKTVFLGVEQVEIICNSQNDCVIEKDSIIGFTDQMINDLTCEEYQNPISRTYNFDNILFSILNIFEMITLEGWTDMMYIVRDVEHSYMYDSFFVSCVVFGSFIILNLMIAVQSSYLDQEFDAEENRLAEIKRKLDKKKKLKLQVEQQIQDYDDEVDEFDNQQVNFKAQQNTQRRQGTRVQTIQTQKRKGCCANYKKPNCFIKVTNVCYEICSNPTFDTAIIVLILLNTLFLSLEHYNQPLWIDKVCFAANIFFTIIFLLEMLAKISAYGCKKYLEDKFNIFDAFIVTMSYVELVMPGDSGISVLRTFRLLRIFKILKSWTTLRALLSTVLESFNAIANLGVLILLFLFISALLGKQFYGEDLLEDDGETVSRYNFKTTLHSLNTMFIVLTGENWNEVMILTIDNSRKFFGPAIFFISLMFIGNFMLLNLFLAILLKSISTNGDSDKDDETKIDNKSKEKQGTNELEEFDDSSNSNIEEEVEQIMNQLKMMSPKAQAKRKDAKMDSVKIHQELMEPETFSLCMFSSKGWFRKSLNQMIQNTYFDGLIYYCIAFNSLLLALDQPVLEDSYQKKTLKLMSNIISGVFVGECLIKMIALGFFYGDRAYIKDNWNKLDFFIVLFSFITWIMEAFFDNDLSFIACFRALRALRPLRAVSKNEGIKNVVNALLESIPALMNVLLIVLLFLLVFGILGIQFFSGMLGTCSDLDDGKIVDKAGCTGQYKNDILDFNGDPVDFEMVDREWIVPANNYNNVLESMSTFFEISTLEMWPDMMFLAADSVGVDIVPVEKSREWVAIIYVIFIFLTTFFILNLFISVIVDKFNEQIKKREGSDMFTPEQKEWVKINRLLLHTNPRIIPVEPVNRFRHQCFIIVQSQFFEYMVMLAIVLNTFFMCIDHYGKPPELEIVLARANYFFVVFFFGEMILKLTGYGFKYYWYINWNKFDLIVVMFSLIALNEDAVDDFFNPTVLRIIRVARLFRMVKTNKGLKTLLKTLFLSIGNILNSAALLMLIFFTFTIAGMGLFGEVPDGEFIDHNVNFRSFYISMMTLFRASTGESWNGIMHDCRSDQGILAMIFWILFQLIAFLIFMNIFIAVIGESLGESEGAENENDILALKKKDIKAFQNTWAKYNPMGELLMRTVRLPNFLRELPPPLGFAGIRIEDSKLNKFIFCLNIKDHTGFVYYPEVMWAIFHSLAGMNDPNVQSCNQIKNILKIVKQKYKGPYLDKKLTLDSLCGNKYQKNDNTAIKYIQAMKILNYWKLHQKNKLKKEHEQKQIREIEAFGRNTNIQINTDHYQQDKPFENNSEQQDSSIHVDQEQNNMRDMQRNQPNPVQANSYRNRNQNRSIRSKSGSMYSDSDDDDSFGGNQVSERGQFSNRKQSQRHIARDRGSQQKNPFRGNPNESKNSQFQR